MTFTCRERLLEWVQNEASKLGFDFVVASVIYGLHNHALETKLHGHPIVCRLNREEKDAISELLIIKVMPRNILADLKRKRLDSISNIKKVYKERYKHNISKIGSRSELQQLLKLLGDNQYFSTYRACEDNVTIRDVFWTHPESINLFNTFPTVLIIDSTCKTNKHRLPLLEIVGVTFTDMTFSVGFTFLECEKEDNVTWALGNSKTLLVDQNNMLSVTVNSRDNALMNAVGTVFPTSLQYFIGII
ncbi:protein FAR1-RELATED SEQUENCE 5-like [Vicia villosa]|uniref:protein FAR1-RELATED SEQUENCE 5-like n=1 Tax=Vicia villosa TaxID=3911 RepID=UPI00273B64D4|nr:protein FAR1-RELATED SEQUENCE 5-like [Vicia villosa]